MSGTAHLLVDRRDGIMTLTMNRPEVGNALSPQMLILLARAWYEYRDSADLRVAIFTGAGDKAFCVGGDLKLSFRFSECHYFFLWYLASSFDVNKFINISGN